MEGMELRELGKTLYGLCDRDATYDEVRALVDGVPEERRRAVVNGKYAEVSELLHIDTVCSPITHYFRKDCLLSMLRLGIITLKFLDY